MRIDPAGWPFVIGGLVVAIVGAFFAGTVYGAILLALTVFFLFFFRDPERQISAPDDAVLSPADGRVMLAGPPTAGALMLPTLAAHPVIAPLLLIQSFYRLANDLALARGLDPDAPPHLRKVTETW